ncbi:hypothetical protein GT037_000174 [Alternaria burnsii]|uniref:Uncharacterized protein n=1 Tax=Alternaria burnsii TaxID=1187904 RepID=A0A8H7BGL9_9PLEO|nr:uncharacterized protein GT037_000174 [Alternaria burnsii]KAF7681198.1 hypothetical protein GT037_000174 [Alternaria burnsii]
MESTPEAFQGSYGRIIMHYNNYTSGAFRSDTPSLPPRWIPSYDFLTSSRWAACDARPCTSLYSDTAC